MGGKELGPMKKLSLILAAVATLLVEATPALGIPFLQLGMSGGYYDTSTQTVVTDSSTFTLYALIDPGSADYIAKSTYYISAAMTPRLKFGTNLGSFTWNGSTINATQDMVYGSAPVAHADENDDWPDHSIFSTYFKEFAFELSPGAKAAGYNVQDDPDGFYADPDGALYYAAFELDVSGLAPDYGLHFDLYTKNGDLDVDRFAPFSHDAQCTPVPEPATALILGTGLLTLAVMGRNRIKAQDS